MPCYVKHDDGTWRTLLRQRDGEVYKLRAYGPKQAQHPSIGWACPACGVPFAIGAITTLVPLGPGASEEARKRYREKRWYNAVAIEVHYACVMGFEGTLAEGNEP